MDSPEVIGNSEGLVSLPFTYQRVEDPSQALYKEFRQSMFAKSRGADPSPPKTDEELLERIKGEAESREWYFSDYWREKGLPAEQIEFLVGEGQITLYNFNKDTPFSDEHLQKVTRIFQEFSSRFPKALEQIRWILIDDVQYPSWYGDPVSWPASGDGSRKWRERRLLPRAMSFDPYRVPEASRFEGVFAHELTHPIDDDFKNAGWSEKYKWGDCRDFPDDWELRVVPDGSSQAYFNKHTGKMAPVGQFPLQPDECLNDYAAHNLQDDVCESVVAYIFNPDLLRRVSPGKYSIIERLDQGAQVAEVSAARVPKDQIKLPEIKPEVIPYYIVEPKNIE